MMIAVVAIIVIGPKDLPRALRTVGQWVGKARRVAGDFQDSVDDMVRESELDELRESANKIGTFDYDGPVDPTGGSRIADGQDTYGYDAAPVAPPHSFGVSAESGADAAAVDNAAAGDATEDDASATATTNASDRPTDEKSHGGAS